MKINFVGRLKEGSFSELTGSASAVNTWNGWYLAAFCTKFNLHRERKQIASKKPKAKINQQAALQTKQKPQTKKALTVTS
jgi:hypothetical protein